MEPLLRRVIVVDHRKSVADTFVEILRLHGFEAMALYSGEDAVAIAPAYRPCAVLLDVMLPGLNGLDAAQLILDQLPGCRAILMSGHPQTAELIRSERHSSLPLEILPKPVHPQTILNAIAADPSTSLAIELSVEPADDIKPD